MAADYRRMAWWRRVRAAIMRPEAAKSAALTSRPISHRWTSGRIEHTEQTHLAVVAVFHAMHLPVREEDAGVGLQCEGAGSEAGENVEHLIGRLVAQCRALPCRQLQNAQRDRPCAGCGSEVLPDAQSSLAGRFAIFQSCHAAAAV